MFISLLLPPLQMVCSGLKRPGLHSHAFWHCLKCRVNVAEGLGISVLLEQGHLRVLFEQGHHGSGHSTSSVHALALAHHDWHALAQALGGGGCHRGDLLAHRLAHLQPHSADLVRQHLPVPHNAVCEMSTMQCLRCFVWEY